MSKEKYIVPSEALIYVSSCNKILNIHLYFLL